MQGSPRIVRSVPQSTNEIGQAQGTVPNHNRRAMDQRVTNSGGIYAGTHPRASREYPPYFSLRVSTFFLRV